MKMNRVLTALCAVLVGASLANGQTQIEVKVTTTGPVGLAPAFGAFHDGTYDIFDVGGNATAGLESLAEVGDVAPLIAEAAGAGVPNAAGFAPGGPFAPSGGMGSTIFTVSPTETHFSFASMILPSNDWFIGTGDAVDISSLLGASIGTSLSIDLTRGYDAGTEAEDFAFAPGGGLVGITTAADPGAGLATADPIAVLGANPFAGFASVEPADFDLSSLDFTGGTIATVELSVVPEPATGGMMVMGVLASLGIFRRRR